MTADDAGHAVNTLTSVGINAISFHLGEFSQGMKKMEQGVAAVGTTVVTPVAETTAIEQVAA
jgi:hypothetical protein